MLCYGHRSRYRCRPSRLRSPTPPVRCPSPSRPRLAIHLRAVVAHSLPNLPPAANVPGQTGVGIRIGVRPLARSVLDVSYPSLVPQAARRRRSSSRHPVRHRPRGAARNGGCQRVPPGWVAAMGSRPLLTQRNPYTTMVCTRRAASQERGWHARRSHPTLRRAGPMAGAPAGSGRPAPSTAVLWPDLVVLPAQEARPPCSRPMHTKGHFLPLPAASHSPAAAAATVYSQDASARG